MAAAGGALPADTRFFAGGGFFTESGKGQFVPVGFKAPRQTERRYPFSLNTGRIRDQWHTMTRTGKTPRLTAHFAEPFAELNPIDAAKLGIDPADLVTVKSPYGAVIVRALLTDRVALEKSSCRCIGPTSLHRKPVSMRSWRLRQIRIPDSQDPSSRLWL